MLIALSLLSLQEPAESAPPPPPPIPRMSAVEKVLLTVPEEYKDAMLTPAYAPDGARVAVLVQLPSDGALILSDGAASEVHDFVRAPRFSADGKHLAWAWGSRKDREHHEWELILDGKRARKADWIGAVVFAPVGDDYAVWTGKDVKVNGEGIYEGGEYTCTWGRKKADGYSEAPWQEPQWSADGKHLGFIGRKPSRSVAVLDGKEYGPYYFASGFTWSPDGKIAAWTGTKDYDEFLIFTAKKEYGQEYESVGAPTLGENGAMAYLARMRGRAVLIFLDNIVPGFYDDLGTPAVSPNGKRVVVAASNGRAEVSGGWFVDNSWMDGSENWNEDTASLAASGSKCFMVLDARKIGLDWWRVVRPNFSPDSAHVTARARSADGWQVLLDDKVSPAYDAVDTPRFSADGKSLEFGARRGRELLWVKLAVE